MKIKFLVIKVFKDESELIYFLFFMLLNFLFVERYRIVLLILVGNLYIWVGRRRFKLFLDLLYIFKVYEWEMLGNMLR